MKMIVEIEDGQQPLVTVDAIKMIRGVENVTEHDPLRHMASYAEKIRDVAEEVLGEIDGYKKSLFMSPVVQSIKSMFTGFRNMRDIRVALTKDEFISKIRDMFKNAHRLGDEVDEPEGVRYVQISSTLADDIVSMANILLAEESGE